MGKSKFANTSGGFTNSFSVNVGSKVGIRVYVRDNSVGAATFNGETGLGSAAVRLTYNTPTTGLAAVTVLNDIVENTTANGGPFDLPGARSFDANSAAMTVGALAAGVVPDGNGRVLIGTFFVTGQSVGTVTLNAQDFNPGSPTDITGFDLGTGYDLLLAPGPFTATLSITPVPEPACLLGLAAVGLLAGRRRLTACVG